MTDDDLRINTLHRFAKHSSRLILTEYSSCEIPAGCGGVVLRWTAADAPIPAEVRVHAGAADSDVWLDGQPLVSSTCEISAGEHCIAIHFRHDASTNQPFTVAVNYLSAEGELVSRGAPRWHATTTRPPNDWIAPGFDDTAWSAPTVMPDAELAALNTWTRELYEKDRAGGQTVFALARDTWLRVRFTVLAEAR